MVPIPASEEPAEHDRIRSSNDRDRTVNVGGDFSAQSGYDEDADGAVLAADIERVVDED